MSIWVMWITMATAQATDIRKAHLVWMNHLDVGYTNTIASVLNQYFHEVWGLLYEYLTVYLWGEYTARY